MPEKDRSPRVREDVSPLKIPAADGAATVDDLLMKLEMKEQNEEVLIDRLR